MNEAETHYKNGSSKNNEPYYDIRCFSVLIRKTKKTMVCQSKLFHILGALFTFILYFQRLRSIKSSAIAERKTPKTVNRSILHERLSLLTLKRSFREYLCEFPNNSEITFVLEYVRLASEMVCKEFSTLIAFPTFCKRKRKSYTTN